MLVTPMTDGCSHLVHLITDDNAMAGRATGRYVACCGDIVVAASLTTPGGKDCRPCGAWAQNMGIR